MLTKNSGGALALGPATSLRVLCGSQPILAKSTGGINKDFCEIHEYIRSGPGLRPVRHHSSQLAVPPSQNWGKLDRLCSKIPKDLLHSNIQKSLQSNKVLIYGGENVPQFVACSAV